MKQTLAELLNAVSKGKGDTFQNGVKPGTKKLAQFTMCALIAGTPALGSQDGKGDAAIAFIKLFDPCGSWSWFISEFDPATGEAFGIVHGFEKELGYIDLSELANTRGKMGIGIELDMHWTPRALSEC